MEALARDFLRSLTEEPEDTQTVGEPVSRATEAPRVRRVDLGVQGGDLVTLPDGADALQEEGGVVGG